MTYQIKLKKLDSYVYTETQVVKNPGDINLSSPGMAEAKKKYAPCILELYREELITTATIDKK